MELFGISHRKPQVWTIHLWPSNLETNSKQLRFLIILRSLWATLVLSPLYQCLIVFQSYVESPNLHTLVLNSTVAKLLHEFHFGTNISRYGDGLLCLRFFRSLVTSVLAQESACFQTWLCKPFDSRSICLVIQGLRAAAVFGHSAHIKRAIYIYCFVLHHNILLLRRLLIYSLGGSG